MHRVKELVKREIECFGEHEELSRNDVEPLYYLIKTYYKLKILEEMKHEREYEHKGEHHYGYNAYEHPHIYFTKGYDPYSKHGYKRSTGGMHEEFDLTPTEIESWAKGLVNADGSMGAHWTKTETTPWAKSHGVMLGDEITEDMWWITVNMIYSDKCKTAKKYGVDKPDFYADLAKDFLHDEDSVPPYKKLAAYYETIVKPAK